MIRQQVFTTSPVKLSSTRSVRLGLIVVISCVFLVGFGACKKKESKPAAGGGAAASDTSTTSSSSSSGSTSTVTVSIAAPSNQTGTVGDSFSFTPTVTVSGGTLSSCSLTGSAPGWMSFSTSTCAITGTPTAALTSSNSFTVTATSGSTSSTSSSFTITVPAVSLAYTDDSETYQTSVAITNNDATLSNFNQTVTYTVSPSLPTGLSINSSTGRISGTPTTATAEATYTVTASYSGASIATKALTFTVASPPSMAFTTVNETGSSDPSTYSNAGTTFIDASNVEINGTCETSSTLSATNATVTTNGCGNGGNGTFKLTVTPGTHATEKTVTATLTKSGLSTSISATYMYCDSGSMSSLPSSAAYAGGAGTSGDPYQIATAAQLVKLKEDTSSNTENGKYYKLTANLDLKCTMWSPIGDSSEKFSGYFDGNNKTISYMMLFSMASPQANNYGMFGATTASNTATTPVVKNLTLNAVTADAGNYVGALIGYMEYGRVSGITVTGTVRSSRASGYTGGLIGEHWGGIDTTANASTAAIDTVSFTGSVHSMGSGAPYTGGIVGSISKGSATDPATINAATVVTNVLGGGNYVGGIAGYALGNATSGTILATIKSSTASGAIGSTSSGSSYEGGLVGKLSGGAILSSTSSATVDSSTGSIIGGLAGEVSGSAAVTSSSSTGAVTGTSGSSNYVGGAVGYLDTASVSKSYATGAATGKWRVGGLVGQVEGSGSITDSYATGNVTAVNLSGGLAGVLNGSGGTTQMTRSYYRGTGSITNSGSRGDLVGYCSDATVVKSYGLSNYAAVIGTDSWNCTTTTAAVKSATELKTQSTFVDWDFSTIWSITDGSTYPSLR